MSVKSSKIFPLRSVSTNEQISSVITSSRFCFVESEAFFTPTALISTVSSFSSIESLIAIISTKAEFVFGLITIDPPETEKSGFSTSEP